MNADQIKMTTDAMANAASRANKYNELMARGIDGKHFTAKSAFAYWDKKYRQYKRELSQVGS